MVTVLGSFVKFGARTLGFGSTRYSGSEPSAGGLKNLSVAATDGGDGEGMLVVGRCTMVETSRTFIG